MSELEQAPARVLVVSSDEAIRKFTEGLLAHDGLAPVGAAGGVEALELAQREPFELVILDVDLTGEPNAFSLCRELKGLAKLSWLPVLFLTGTSAAETVGKVFEAGADDFVDKPFRPDELAVRAKVLVRKGGEERWLVERAGKLAEKIAERDDELEELRRFAQDIVSSLPSALLVLDAAGGILYANVPLLELLQAERRNVVGKPFSELLGSAALRELMTRAVESAIKAGQPSRLRRVTGFPRGREDRFCDLIVAPIDYAGVRQVLVVVEDVTEQARAEAAVATERAKLHSMVNAASAALCLMDRERRIVWKNRTFDLWFGEARDQPGLAAFQTRLALDESWYLPVFNQGQVRYVRWRIFTPLGQARHFSNTIAPVREDPARPVEQALVLTQDVTEQEVHVEQLSLLHELSELLQGTLDAERLNRVILLCVTAGHALGFNRAFLFKRDRDSNVLAPQMAVGPSSREEAFRIWGELSSQNRSLQDLVADLERSPPKQPSPLWEKVKDLRYRLDDPSEVISRTALEKRPQVVSDAALDPRVSESFRKSFGCQVFVSVPIIAKGAVLGVLLADNLYSGRPITLEHVKLLSLFAGQAALAIENADTYAELRVRVSQLRTAQDRVVHGEKLAAVGAMAAHVAHEIRNPLTVIGGFARAILRRPAATERVERNARIILEEASRLESLLKGVMDFARPIAPVLRVGDLNAVAERAFRTHVENLGAKHIQGDLDPDSSLPELAFDENQMLQVLTNLIKNAADSMPKGGALTLRTRRDGENALLEVADTGSGIAPEVMDRMFSPFYTTKRSGAGLGLAVCRKIVEDHGGRIEVKSEVGRGSTFSIYLPLHPAAPAPAGTGAQGERKQ